MTAWTAGAQVSSGGAWRGSSPRARPLLPAALAHPTPSPVPGYCTFQVDVHDGLLRNDIEDVDDSGGMNDSGGALAGSLHEWLIQDVSFQQGHLDLALELCVNTLRSLEGFLGPRVP